MCQNYSRCMKPNIYVIAWHLAASGGWDQVVEPIRKLDSRPVWSLFLCSCHSPLEISHGHQPDWSTERACIVMIKHTAVTSWLVVRNLRFFTAEVINFNSSRHPGPVAGHCSTMSFWILRSGFLFQEWAAPFFKKKKISKCQAFPLGLCAPVWKKYACSYTVMMLAGWNVNVAIWWWTVW